MFSAMYGLHEGQHYFAVDGTIHAQSSLYLEVLKNDFENHIQQMGIFPGELNYVGGLVTSHAYPVYNRKNLDQAKALKERIQSLGLHVTGRQGEFDYVSSADAAFSAYRLAHQLRGDRLGDDARSSQS